MTLTLAEAESSVLGVAHTRPGFDVPAGASDCHVHVFGPFDRFPLFPGRLYTPGQAALPDLLTRQRALGLDRVVVVQPSPYGADNSCMIDALRRLGPRARGVAVVEPSAPARTLSGLNEAGVRGIRINLETGGVTDPEVARSRLAEAAEQAAPLGWHIQLYADLAVIASLHDAVCDLPVPIVLDHFAKARAALGPNQPGLDSVLSLMRRGKAYVKLSAPRRISDRADCRDAGVIAQTLIRAHPAQILWGSDWPHPDAGRSHADPFHPDDDGLALNRLHAWAGSAGLTRRILVDNPARLYGF
ncbi:MAG TPA: amidohydrolase family protein [Microvirga sp.]|nr:amidohydrolase family protein [Microvirga sp.]